MKYTKGTLGRVFLLKFEDGDILLESLGTFAKREKLKAALVIFIGALKKGELVTGPKSAVIPPLPNKVNFKDAWETLGIGTIFTNSKGPQIHIHSAMGKKLKTLTGCVRKPFLSSRVLMFTKSHPCRSGKSLPITPTWLNRCRWMKRIWMSVMPMCFKVLPA